ncbi:MAG: IPT/TIG domain-containing protein [bacterium]|nr:IPT/TIG domain-containing protein [bacterium]
MSKLIKNSINIALIMLIILALGLLLLPAPASAEGGYNTTYGEPYVFTPNSGPVETEQAYNPKPIIYSLSPKSGDQSPNARTITINGSGFIPSSIARINGTNRSTTFIDSTHLLLNVNGADMYQRDGGFYVTVYNGAPGGGFSNSKFFTVKNVIVNPAQVNQDPQNNYNGMPGEPEDFSNLTSNVIYGGNTFLPSGAVQWVLFAIIILLLVMLARKLFGGEEAYHATPLKHD